MWSKVKPLGNSVSNWCWAISTKVATARLILFVWNEVDILGWADVLLKVGVLKCYALGRISVIGLT